MPVGSFDFEESGRTYSCRIEKRNEPSDVWWWFVVSGDKHRYAPFRAAGDDTKVAVQLRIAIYYRDLVARRQARQLARSW